MSATEDADTRVIDLLHLGEPKVIAAWIVDDVIVDCGPSSTLPTLLEALGDWRPSAILLTHIHFDHAGGAGTLVQRWPDVKVYVHERGARHLRDPERLYSSAKRLYGGQMERLWGPMIPIPEENLVVLHGGETIHHDRFQVQYTPGHASHHVSFLRDGTAYVGDVAGVRIGPDSIAIPPTPPPDIDIELWHESIATVRAWRPRRLAMTHWGESTDVTAQLAQLDQRLDDWAALARDGDRERFVAEVQAEIRREGSPEQAAKYQQAAPVDQLYLGYERYWAKRAERAQRG